MDTPENSGVTDVKPVQTPGGSALLANLRTSTALPTDSSIVGTTQAAIDNDAMTSDQSSVVSTMLYDFEEDEKEIEIDENLEPIAAYKHRRIKRFTVGKFEFFDHVLRVFNEEDNDEFLRLHRGLVPQDRANIVILNLAALQAVETPISRTMTGAQSTGRIKDPKSIK